MKHAWVKKLEGGKVKQQIRFQGEAVGLLRLKKLTKREKSDIVARFNNSLSGKGMVVPLQKETIPE